MSKISDAFFSTLNLKTALPVASLDSGDLVPVYDASAAAWKMAHMPDMASDAEVETRIGGSTAAELNLLDVSAQTETILVAGAVSVVKRITHLSAASGTYAVTLAAPDVTMLGQVKIINMSVAGNNITMALTNVQGGTAATTATFNAADECLVLIAGIGKWHVVGESGVTLS